MICGLHAQNNSCVIGAFFIAHYPSTAGQLRIRKGTPHHGITMMKLPSTLTYNQLQLIQVTVATSHTTADMKMCANEAYVHVNPIV